MSYECDWPASLAMEAARETLSTRPSCCTCPDCDLALTVAVEMAKRMVNDAASLEATLKQLLDAAASRLADGR